MKVSDGRKTKGKIGQKNEKAKLDKEWNKVRREIIRRENNFEMIENTSCSIFTKLFDSSENIRFDRHLAGVGNVGNITCVLCISTIFQPGVQNSFRCLAAENLCLAKRVNRDISVKCDTMRVNRNI